VSRRAIAITAVLVVFVLLAGVAATLALRWALQPALASAPSAIFDVRSGARVNTNSPRRWRPPKS